MESKKINQLATELTPALSDLTIIGDPTTGISKKITLSQMASLFTGTVEEYPNLASFPLVGTADTIYIALDTNIIYRWNTGTSAYVELSPNIVTSLVFSDANGFDGTISLVGSTATLTITTALTQGSVPFIGTSGALSQDNANLFFDDTNNRLGINTNTPTTALDVFGSGIIGRLNGTSTNNAFLGFASAGSNKWSIGNVQSDHRFRIYSEANAAELVSVLQTGEVGIGIANPTTKLHIDGGASALIANLDANVSVAKSISFRSDNSNRFNIEVSGTESGSNAGANFFIRRYSDVGALIDTPLTITRSTGAITLANTLNGTNAIFSSTLSSSQATFTAAVTPLIVKGTNASTMFTEYYYNTSTLVGSIGNGSGLLTGANASDFIIRSEADFVIASNGNNRRLTIASTGSVGIGTTPPTTTNFANFFVGRNISMFSGSSTDIYIGSNFYYDGGFKVRYSEASAMINTNAGDIIFQNSSSGTAGGTFNGIERLRINSSGNVGIGTSSPSARLSIANSSCIVDITSTTSTSFVALEMKNGGGSFYFGQDSSTSSFFGGGAYSGCLYMSGNYPISFFTNGTKKMELSATGCLRVEGNTMGWTIGQVSGENRIQYNGSSFVLLSTGNGFTAIAASAFNVNSDYRLKEDLKPFNNSLDILNKIKIYDFKWKANNERNYGVIAHELQEVLPYIVYGEKDGMEENGDIRTQGVDYGKIVPILVKGIQELQQQIEELKALINK